MATATSNNESTTETPEIAQKIRKGLLSIVQQGHQLSVDAAQTWVTALSVLPVADLPKIPGMCTLPTLEASTTFAFDVATDLLNAQRDFALELGNVFTSAKSA